MPEVHAGTERLGAFSDGVIAVIITIMVLELKAPHVADPQALLALWPTFVSYALSYVLVATIWVNHHHQLRYAERADARVIWANFALLFFVSLLPFFTQFMAENRISSFTAALYAGDFLFITIAFMLFHEAIVRQMELTDELACAIRAATRRNWIALLVFAISIPIAYLNPEVALALVLIVPILYLAPQIPRLRAHSHE